MNRNYGSGGFKGRKKGSTNWRGTRLKINGGFTSSTTKAKVIPFPYKPPVRDEGLILLGGRWYRIRPGSWVDRLWRRVAVPMHE